MVFHKNPSVVEKRFICCAYVIASAHRFHLLYSERKKTPLGTCVGTEQEFYTQHDKYVDCDEAHASSVSIWNANFR